MRPDYEGRQVRVRRTSKTKLWRVGGRLRCRRQGIWPARRRGGPIESHAVEHRVEHFRINGRWAPPPAPQGDRSSSGRLLGGRDGFVRPYAEGGLKAQRDDRRSASLLRRPHGARRGAAQRGARAEQIRVLPGSATTSAQRRTRQEDRAGIRTAHQTDYALTATLVPARAWRSRPRPSLMRKSRPCGVRLDQRPTKDASTSS